MKTPHWTDEQYAPVKALAEAGHTFSYIAKTLNYTVSTIAGQLFRRGYIKPPKLQLETETSKVERLKKPLSDVQHPCHPAPDSLFLPLLDLPDKTCKFAVGEDEYRHLFCAAPSYELQPYCLFHCKLAYRPYYQ